MIRFILIMAFVVLYLILFLPVLIFEWVLQHFNRRAADISSLRMVQWAFKVILKMTGSKITYLGEEKVPTDQAVLFVADHHSYFDILVTYTRCRDLTGYISKDSMGKIPLFSTWMKRLYCLFLNREDPKVALRMISTATDYIKKGISICIFPEGTRNKTEDPLLPFKEGSMRMAIKSGCPIVPIAISNTAQIWEAHFPKIRPAQVIVEYCDPIYPKNYSRAEQKTLGKISHDIIEQKLMEHQNLLQK